MSNRNIKTQTTNLNYTIMAIDKDIIIQNLCDLIRLKENEFHSERFESEEKIGDAKEGWKIAGESIKNIEKLQELVRELSHRINTLISDHNLTEEHIVEGEYLLAKAAGIPECEISEYLYDQDDLDWEDDPSNDGAFRDV